MRRGTTASSRRRGGLPMNSAASCCSEILARLFVAASWWSSLDDTRWRRKGAAGVGHRQPSTRIAFVPRHQGVLLRRIWVVTPNAWSCGAVQPPAVGAPCALPAVPGKKTARSRRRDPPQGRPKTARELVQLVASWVKTRRIRVLGDSAYCCAEVRRNLPCSSVLVSCNAARRSPYDAAGSGACDGPGSPPSPGPAPHAAQMAPGREGASRGSLRRSTSTAATKS